MNNDNQAAVTELANLVKRGFRAEIVNGKVVPIAQVPRKSSRKPLSEEEFTTKEGEIITDVIQKSQDFWTSVFRAANDVFPATDATKLTNLYARDSQQDYQTVRDTVREIVQNASEEGFRLAAAIFSLPTNRGESWAAGEMKRGARTKRERDCADNNDGADSNEKVTKVTKPDAMEDAE